jgi:hypothetical protein
MDLTIGELARRSGYAVQKLQASRGIFALQNGIDKRGRKR